MPIDVETTTESRLRREFADAVRKAREACSDEERLFRLAAVAAAGALVCTLLKSLGVRKEKMFQVMNQIWEDQGKSIAKGPAN